MTGVKKELKSEYITIASHEEFPEGKNNIDVMGQLSKELYTHVSVDEGK